MKMGKVDVSLSLGGSGRTRTYDKTVMSRSL